jgi:hypothetical protein
VWTDMSLDQEKFKALLALKTRLEKRITEIEAEQAELKNSLDAVNTILLEKGFKRGNIKDAEKQAKDAQIAAANIVKAAEPVAKPVQTITASSTKETTSTKESIDAKPKTSGYQGGEPENVIPLKSISDESLAIIYVEKDSIHVLPDESKHFTVNTPPFSNFLVERVLAKMQDKDTELVRMKQLSQDKMFSYNIIREGDLIREIVIRNVDEDRFRELKSSIRWTLEKMYEKVKNPQ